MYTKSRVFSLRLYVIARYNGYMEGSSKELTTPKSTMYVLGEHDLHEEEPLDVLNEQREVPLLEQDLLPPAKDGIDFDLDAQEASVLGNIKRSNVVTSEVVSGASVEPSRRRRVHMFEYAIKSPGSKESVAKEPQFKSVDDAVLGVLNGKSLSREELMANVKTLVEQGDIAQDDGDSPITDTAIGVALINLMNNNLLASDGEGKLRVYKIAGGSTHGSENGQTEEALSTKPTLVEKMNRIVDKVTNKALEGTAYGRLVAKLQSVIDSAPDKVKVELQELSQKITDSKGIENILSNLATIDGWVPDSEYANLVTIAEQAAEEQKQHESVVSVSTSTSATPMFPKQTPRKVSQSVQIRPSIFNTERLSTEELNRRAEEARNAKIEKLATEKTDEEKTALIEGVQNFDELYSALKECKVIKSSDGTNLTAEELISKIEEIGRQDSVGFDYLVKRGIARTHGLRDKVRELWKAENAQNMAQNEPVPPPVYVPGTQPTVDLYDEPIGPVRKEDLSPEESEKIEREMRESLGATREKFATHEAAYKTKVREGKKTFRSLMEKLGVPEKQRPATEREAEHIEAEKAYMEAKWNLKNFISGRSVKEVEFSHADSLLGLDHVENKKIDVGVLEQAEKEYSLLQDRMLEMTPEKERSTVEKAFQKWNSLPLEYRVGLSAALLTAGGVALGTVGVSGALSALVWRAGRALVGTNIGLAAGRLYGNAKEKEVKEKRAERLDEYGSTKTLEKDQFIAEEKELEKFFDQEKSEIRKNQIKKGLVTAAVAGVSTVGIGMGGQALVGESVPSGAKVSGNIDSAPKPKVVADANTVSTKSWFDKIFSDNEKVSVKPSALEASDAPQKIDVPFELKGYEPIGVKLSNEGFIDTVSKLKAGLQGHSVSPAVEKLLAQSPEKIAMDLGLYKPGQVAESAFGLQGEELTMNINGDIALMHNDGSVNILFDASGNAHQFGEYAGNAMFDADHAPASPLPKDVPPVKTPVVVETGVKSIPSTPEVGISATSPLASVAMDSGTVGLSLTEAPTPKVINFDQIVAPSADYTSPQDMVVGKLPLKPEYQFDPKFKAERTAYNVRLEKELMNVPHEMFDLRYPIEYNGGRINVFWKAADTEVPNIKKVPSIRIFLNGQLIGMGDIIDGQPGLQYEASLGKGMLGVKSDFEQAFEKARAEIEKNKMFFKKVKK